jgi:hypothetical protein
LNELSVAIASVATTSLLRRRLVGQPYLDGPPKHMSDELERKQYHLSRGKAKAVAFEKGIMTLPLARHYF